MLPGKIRRGMLIASVVSCLGAVGGAQTPAPAPVEPAPPKSPAAPAAPARKLSALAEAPDWRVLEAFSGAVSREEFEAAVTAIYSDGSSGASPWKISPGKVSVETGPDQGPVEVAFRDPVASDKPVPRYWHTLRELPPLKPDEPPLKGLHVALDPGHIGGAYAKMEERWLSMMPGTEIMEGSLVLQVSQALKPRLETLGARVSLVRAADAPVTTAKIDDLKAPAREILKEAGIANPKETYAGIEGDARVATVQWQAEKLFYRVSEIHARAKKVNEEIQPDLVVCLHLNAEPWGDPTHTAFVDRNHFHLLVNGCYSGEELQFEDVRFDLLRRLFTRAHEEERRMADVFAAALAEATGLPPFVYVTKNARRVTPSPYVYARNLLANRTYLCPVLYCEPYVMNHEQTYTRLLLGRWAGRTLVDGALVTSPIEDYVRGVVQGLVECAKKERRAAP